MWTKWIEGGTSSGSWALLEDAIGHDEGFILVLGYKLVGNWVDVYIEQSTLIASLIVEERTLLQFPTLLDAGREGVAHLAFLLDLADPLQLLRARLVAHLTQQRTEDLDGKGDTGLWYRGAACLSSIGWVIIFIMKMACHRGWEEDQTFTYHNRQSI